VEFDLPLGFSPDDPAAIARQAEDSGFNAVWSTEAGHDPYLPLVPAALATKTIQVGTAIAVAFPRSPLVHAQAAWDLQRWSKGRFILGLGAQVKAHNERRYSVPGDRPVARMQDLIRAIRAIWKAWQTGEKLDYHGEFYTHNLMPPFFNPGPLSCDPPPIYLAAVTEPMIRVAGAEADGIHVHPLHTERYLDSVLLPAARQSAGKNADQFSFCVPAMIATGKTAADVEDAKPALRAQVAFYASTPSYRAVLEIEGKGDVADKLHTLSRSGGWAEMPDLIDDDLFAAVVTTATWDDLAEKLAERYRGRGTRLMPYAVMDDQTPWREIANQLRDRTKD
jgi:probable F420-dependent oxidoreductase